MRQYGARSRLYILGGGATAVAGLAYGIATADWGTTAFFALALVVMAIALSFDPRRADRSGLHYAAVMALLLLLVLVHVTS